MAFMNQARKKALQALCKTALRKFPAVKWSLAVRNHSTIVLTIAEGDIDFEACAVWCPVDEARGSRLRNGHCDVNRYSLDRVWSGRALELLEAANRALSTGNHDRSDSQSDYVDVGWYVDMQVGRWDEPYRFVGVAAEVGAEGGERTAAE